MNKLVLTLSLLGAWPLSVSWAQLAPPNDAGVAVGQWHTIVRDIDASKKFWTLMGGRAIRIDGVDVMKFPGVLVFLTQGSPTGAVRERR